MKKFLLICAAVILAVTPLCVTASAAVTDYTLTASATSGGQDVSYVSAVINTPHEFYWTLRGLATATAVATARFNIAITKPTPGAGLMLTAVDTGGVSHDVATLGYWGPPAGFPVSNATNDTTMFTGTFDTLGQYDITVQLVDLATGQVMAAKTLIVNVIDALAGIMLLPATRTINVGEVFRLLAEPLPGTSAIPALLWSSNGPSIATVDSYGNVTGISEGRVTITARSADGTFVAQATITVVRGVQIPQTGGNANPLAMAALVVMAAMSVVLRVGFFRKKTR